MANELIQPRQLPPATQVYADGALIVDDGTIVQRATPQQVVDAANIIASDISTSGGSNVQSRLNQLTSSTESASEAAQTAIDLISGKTPQYYGAIGDGVADDTAAITQAMLAGAEVNWGNGVYRYTSPISVTLPLPPLWTATDARLVYDGPVTDLPGLQIKVLPVGRTGHIENMVFDGGFKCTNAIDLLAETQISNAGSEWPSIWWEFVRGQNVRLATDAAILATALSTRGGFDYVNYDNCEASDVYMSANVGYANDRAVGGIRTAFHPTNFLVPKQVNCQSCTVENVWCEGKTGLLQEADAVSFMQDVGIDQPADDTCFINDLTVSNTGNRIIKLHSAARAIVNGVQFTQRASVLPFSGQMRTAAIDAQQGGVIIQNVKGVYDGVWPPFFVQNYTEQADHARQGGQTETLNIRFTPGTNGETVLVRHRNDNLVSPNVSDTDFAVSGITSVGQIKGVIQVGARLAGSGRIRLHDVSASCTQSAVIIQSTTEVASLTIFGSQVFQNGPAVPFATRTDLAPLDLDWVVGGVLCPGFTDLVAIQPGRGGKIKTQRGIGSGGAPFSATSLWIDADDQAIAQMMVAAADGNTAGLQLGTPGTGYRGGFLMRVGATLADDYLSFRAGNVGDVLRLYADGPRLGADVRISAGNGAPNFAAAVGSIYMRRDGGAGSTFYVKESGTGTTGWVAK